MDVQKILSLIPPDLLDGLADENQVNKFTKKLQGQLVFKLLLYSILSHNYNSPRTM